MSNYKTADGYDLVIGNEYYITTYFGEKPPKRKFKGLKGFIRETNYYYFENANSEPINNVFGDYKNALTDTLKKAKFSLSMYKRYVSELTKAISELERAIKG